MENLNMQSFNTSKENLQIFNQPTSNYMLSKSYGMRIIDKLDYLKDFLLPRPSGD